MGQRPHVPDENLLRAEDRPDAVTGVVVVVALGYSHDIAATRQQASACDHRRQASTEAIKSGTETTARTADRSGPSRS